MEGGPCGDGRDVVSSSCALCGGRPSSPLFSKGGRDFLECAACGLVWVDPQPTRAELDHHYESSYRDGGYSMFSDAEEIRRGIAEYRLDAIRGFARVGRWLDVGCSGGEFLEAAKRAGIQAEGLDLSEEAVLRACARGLTAHHSRVEDFAPERHYDTVTGFDVIEHTVDPRAFVRRCREWLVPDGSFVLTLPDVDSIYPRLLMRRHWFYYAPNEHLFYFNSQTITRLLDQEGFAVERVSRTCKPLTLSYGVQSLSLFNKTLGKLATRMVSALPRRLASRTWTLYVGEMMVRARRTGAP